ncbi:MAG: aldo/keto reductase [Thermoguttaceae bacterium]
MKYRKFGKSDRLVSALGFGTMRLPTTGKPADIDEPAAEKMLCRALDDGVNYVDTAYPYHEGNSERLVGKVLANGYRSKVSLATKMPVWDVNESEDFDRFLNEQLDKLQTEHIDFYLLHTLQSTSWRKVRELGVIEWSEGAKADGRIGRLGFSFHDTLDAFKEIVDDHDWPFCQIQYNYVAEQCQAGTEGLNYAAEKGLAVIIMEPLFGGSLVDLPEGLKKAWDAHGEKRTPADFGLQWLWDKPQVSLVLSGMSTMEQVEENVESAARSAVGSFSKEDHRLVSLLQAAYEELSPAPCTKCGYCLPCPNGVDIPTNIDLYNAGVVFKKNSLSLSKNLYAALPEEQKASACAACGECEEKCPQKIEVAELMPRIHEELKAAEKPKA